MKKLFRIRQRLFVALAVVSLGVMAFASTAGATITAPTIDVEPLGQGILDSLTSNLPTILTVAGILAGAFFVLRMAKRWFGARSSA